MTDPLSTAPRRGRRRISLALLLLLAGLPLLPARAGPDDFEFGKELAKARYFDYAREVFDSILSSSKSSDESKDEARYGIALLKREEAIAATARQDAKQEEIQSLFESAAQDIEQFVKKNPSNKNADAARLDVGQTRLAFVQWAREMLEDPGEIADRGYDADKLRAAAADSVKRAIEYFGGLKPADTASNPTPLQELANYYYVISQYYAALVEPPCSPSAVSSFTNASELLDNYIMLHEGQLLAVYAMDILGLVWWERARCEPNDEEKTKDYNQAYEWFEACINTPDDGPEYLQVIASGYYHLGEAGLDAGPRPRGPGGGNFARDALTELEKMNTQHPTVWRTDSGLRAMLEWAKLECQRGNARNAVAIANDAGARARQASKPFIERTANRQLTEFVSGGCGGSVTGLDPEVLGRVAQDFMARSKYPEAIRAYRGVIASTPNTPEAFVAYRWDAWLEIARAYLKMDDSLGYALALEAIHEAWIDRRIPHDPESGPAYPNEEKAAGARKRSAQAMDQIAQATGSVTFQNEAKAMLESLGPSYPHSGIVDTVNWNLGLQKFTAAQQMKNGGQTGWEKPLDEARQRFRAVAVDDKSEHQDEAWVMLVRVESLADMYEDEIKIAEEAEAFWETPGHKAQEDRFPTIRARREKARSEVTYFRGDALSKLKRPEEVVKTLDGYLERYPTAARPFPSTYVLSTLISAYLDLGNVEKADTLYRTLLRRDPDFPYLSGVTFKFADRYNEARKKIETDLRDVKVQLNKLGPKLRGEVQTVQTLSLNIADVRNRVTKLENALALHKHNKELEKRGEQITQGVSPELLTAALEEEKTQAQHKELESLKVQVQKATEQRDADQKSIDELGTRRHDLEQQIYEPLTKAAGYYKAWDDTLKTLKADRDPDNLAVFGYMFYTAAKLRPAVADNWVNARAFYEDYLASPKIKAKPGTDDDKRAAEARLGDILVNLAESETNATKRQQDVTRAVDLLQGSIANAPEDNDLVVSMLANKVLVLVFKDTAGTEQRVWRFAIPLPSDVKGVRDAVAKIDNKQANPYYPNFSAGQSQEESQWKTAVSRFKTRLTATNDRVLAGFIPQPGQTPFDPSLYRSLANSASEFRMALAWALARTGRNEDVPKAVNLFNTFLKAPLAAEEDSEDFWRASYGLMRVYVDFAERGLAAGQPGPEVKEALDSAGKLIVQRHAFYPSFGDSVLDDSSTRWKEMLTRLNDLRRKVRLDPVTLVKAAALDTAPPSDGGEKPSGASAPEPGASSTGETPSDGNK